MAEETTLGYLSVPRDFPRASLLDDVLVNYQLCQEHVRHVVEEVRKEQLRSPLLATPDDVLVNYQLCQEHVRHVVEEVRKEQLRSPLLATPEIVGMHFETARNFGWGGFPGEIEWIFRNVVRELGCDMPEVLLRHTGT